VIVRKDASGMDAGTMFGQGGAVKQLRARDT